MLNIIILAVGVILIGFSFRVLLISIRVQKAPKKEILSRTSGIFIEHGMIRAKGRVGVEADKKLSDVYYSSVV